MNIKIAFTGIISAEMIFKDYITFKWNIVYLTEDVLEHVAKYFQNNRYNVKIPRINCTLPWIHKIRRKKKKKSHNNLKKEILNFQELYVIISYFSS